MNMKRYLIEVESFALGHESTNNRRTEIYEISENLTKMLDEFSLHKKTEHRRTSHRCVDCIKNHINFKDFKGNRIHVDKCEDYYNEALDGLVIDYMRKSFSEESITMMLSYIELLNISNGECVRAIECDEYTYSIFNNSFSYDGSFEEYMLNKLILTIFKNEVVPHIDSPIYLGGDVFHYLLTECRRRYKLDNTKVFRLKTSYDSCKYYEYIDSLSLEIEYKLNMLRRLYLDGNLKLDGYNI